jgi:probable F420-dependent oxidoreductase
VGRPLRIGLHLWELPVEGWREQVQRYEQLGFSTITFTDHVVVPQWEPLTALAAIAAVTERIGLGTLVLDIGLRNPVVTAHAAATMYRLSAGRFELGLGAGYVAANFAAAGVPFDHAADRVARLGEAVELMRRLWTEPSTTLHGRFYDVTDSPMVAPEAVRPRILIGGGGPSMMHLAGRVSDTVSMIPRQSSGAWSVADSVPDSTMARMKEKAAWVRAGATESGKDPEAVHLSTMVAKTIVGDDPGVAIAREAAASGLAVPDLLDSTLYLCGTADDVCQRLRHWQEETGITHVSLFDPGETQIAYLADRVLPLLAEG